MSFLSLEHLNKSKIDNCEIFAAPLAGSKSQGIPDPGTSHQERLDYATL